MYAFSTKRLVNIFPYKIMRVLYEEMKMVWKISPSPKTGAAHPSAVSAVETAITFVLGNPVLFWFASGSLKFVVFFCFEILFLFSIRVEEMKKQMFQSLFSTVRERPNFNFVPIYHAYSTLRGRAGRTGHSSTKEGNFAVKHCKLNTKRAFVRECDEIGGSRLTK